MRKYIGPTTSTTTTTKAKNNLSDGHRRVAVVVVAKPVLSIPPTVWLSLVGVVFLRRGKINILATIFYAGIMCIHAAAADRGGWYLYGLTTTTTQSSHKSEGKGVVTGIARGERREEKVSRSGVSRSRQPHDCARCRSVVGMYETTLVATVTALMNRFPIGNKSNLLIAAHCIMVLLPHVVQRSY